MRPLSEYLVICKLHKEVSITLSKVLETSYSNLAISNLAISNLQSRYSNLTIWIAPIAIEDPKSHLLICKLQKEVSITLSKVLETSYSNLQSPISQSPISNLATPISQFELRNLQLRPQVSSFLMPESQPWNSALLITQSCIVQYWSFIHNTGSGHVMKVNCTQGLR